MQGQVAAVVGHQPVGAIGQKEPAGCRGGGQERSTCKCGMVYTEWGGDKNWKESHACRKPHCDTGCLGVADRGYHTGDAGGPTCTSSCT